MFFLIRFGDLKDEAVQSRMFQLAGVPNGTVLSRGIPINYTKRPKNTWLYWFADNTVTQDDINTLSSIPEIKEVKRLHHIKMSIHDPEWKWDDEFLENIFYTNENEIDFSAVRTYWRGVLGLAHDRSTSLIEQAMHYFEVKDVYDADELFEIYGRAFETLYPLFDPSRERPTNLPMLFHILSLPKNYSIIGHVGLSPLRTNEDMECFIRRFGLQHYYIENGPSQRLNVYNATARRATNLANMFDHFCVD